MRFALFFFGTILCGQTLTPVWVELGPDGAALARVVIESGSPCPELRADGRTVAMKVREPVPEGLRPACETQIPAGTRSLRWGKKMLPLPKTPERVVVVGDTGCRIAHGMLQPCDDPALWPFPRVAQRISKRKPDLIVHVGDYLYRESACPAVVSGCAGPHGDNWAAWNADFFHPASEALGAAPWVFARGNHESCERSFRGWFYYLDPRPFSGACLAYSDPYIARSGKLRLGVLDSGSTKDPPHAEAKQIDVYAKELQSLSGQVDWLIDHHPFWGYAAGKSNVGAEPQTLGPAWLRVKPQGIRLILSGHVHLFEFLELEPARLRQVIAGDGGTQLLTGIPRAEQGAAGVMVKAGEVNLSFGFTELDRERGGWRLALRNVHGEAEIECVLPDSATASCEAIRRKQPSSKQER